MGLAAHWNGGRSVDERWADSWGQASGKAKKAWQGVSELGSGEVLFGLAGVSYGWAWWQGESRVKRFSALWFEALADAGIASTVIKYLSGRDRPGSAPYHGNFHGPKFSNTSFVSGHATLAFASAAVFSHEFPTPWVYVPAYTLAAGVGVSRLALEKHWASDVLAGAVLGQSVGSLVMHRSRSEAGARQARWIPWLSADAGGVLWQYNF